MRYSSDYLYEKHIDKIITDARIRRKMGWKWWINI
jgi:hypothetical protein